MSLGMIALIVLIVLLCGGGHFYDGGVYRPWGFGLGGLLLLVLIVLAVSGRL
jgi:hypothetical protein